MMKLNPWVYVAIAVVLFFAGAAVGYRVKVARDDHATVKVQKQAIKDDSAALAERVQQEQALRLGTESALQQEQGKSADLRVQLAAITQRAAALQASIDHAPLNTQPRPAVAGKCPANPYAGSQYQQLYDSAAQGGVAPSH